MNSLMKKSFVLMAVAAVVLSACSKENAYDSSIAPRYTPEGNVLLFATMPQFEDVTKAAIAADGSFSWAVGDKIDVVYTKGGSPDQTYIFSCTNASTGAFEYAGEIADGYTVDRAYYPSGYDGEPSPQHFASLEAAAKGFQMEATVSGGKLQFAHENAMIVVTVKNVPVFAKTVWVNSASVDVTSESGDVVVRIPVIPTADAKLGIGVTDAAWDAASHNDLISKVSEKSHAIEAKNLYNLTALEISPKVHLISSVTGWSAEDGNVIPATGSVCTKTNYPAVPEVSWFRFVVDYGSFTVDYGYNGSSEYNNAVPFEMNYTDSASISMPGVYNISFDFVTGEYTVNLTNIPPFYLIGLNDNWSSFDSSTNPLEHVFGKMFAWKGTTTSSQFKVYLYGDTDWSGNIYGAESQGNWWGPIYTGGSCQNAGVQAAAESVIIFDFGTNPWYHSSSPVSSAPTSVCMRGSFNEENWGSTSGVYFSQHAKYPYIWYIEDFVVDNEGEVKFVENDTAWYGADASWDMKTNPNKCLWAGSNMILATGTYTIYYNAIAHSYSLEVK